MATDHYANMLRPRDFMVIMEGLQPAITPFTSPLSSSLHMIGRSCGFEATSVKCAK